MFEPLLTQPKVIEVTEKTQFVVKLCDSVSDFSLLQAMGGHVAECIVIASEPNHMGVLVRIHPFLTLDILPAVTHSDSTLGRSSSIERCVGQGFRLFSALGASPAMCANLLRQGLSFEVSYIENGDIAFCPLFESKWQLVALENDLRLFGGPIEIRRAKSILARQLDLDVNSESLLLELSEIETVRNDLRHFVSDSSHARHRALVNEISELDNQLLQKKQLISRYYHQAIERPNWQRAANHVENNDDLLRKLAYYQLLAPQELNTMVEQMFLDETQIV
ncbi:hypothetical protein TUM4644_31600 [Shewanella colwelliana]|uniref:Uncharacterized protein n=1 Tax=Shewanella colwelliana TaxID=23 RepID=A0ABQ4P5Y9_SHECO|nr:hypothetical protein [Shewanella colwelliana]GIU31797.1 hypothetical protein TUM4644_31600 [Shewanella colwelliana]GIU42888.1 hypothetical protein TUM3794_27280 [Shewanella colwelliana]